MSESEPATVQTVATRTPPAGRKFPCPKCAARLDFDPASRALHCPYCGYQEAIQPSSKDLEERDWNDFWRNQAKEEQQLAGRASQVACTGCGAVVLLEDKVVTQRCPYCATHLENSPAAAQAMILPWGLLPFAVTQRQAVSAFDAWIAGRWFAPTGLRQFANLGKLTGAYVPYWTFDSMTYTHYTGQRGDDYTVTETYTATETFTETDSNGQSVTRSRPVTRTRQVTHTRWTHVSGEVQHFFDDVMVYASHSLPLDLMGAVQNWDLPLLEGFKPDFLSGFHTERYTVGLKEGFDQARGIMDGKIRELCRQQIGGDHQRVETVRTQHVGVAFKHILLPVWVAAYRYHDQPYRIIVNGRTAEVAGTRPYSWIKIALLVLAIILLVLLGFALFAGMVTLGHGMRELDSGVALLGIVAGSCAMGNISSAKPQATERRRLRVSELLRSPR